MHPLRTIERRALTILLAVPLSLMSCGADGENGTSLPVPEGQGLHQALTLVAGPGPGPDLASRETAALTVPAGIDPWVVRADRFAVIPVPARGQDEAQTVLKLEGDKSMRVDIPGEFDPGSFNQVAVTVWCPQKEDFLVQLRRKGKLILKTPGRRIRGERRPQTVLFDMPGTGRESEPFTVISILFAGRSELAGLVSVRLIQRPWLAWVPTVESGGDLVSLGLEARSALGLSTRHPLRTAFTAPRDAQLAFSFGLPPALRRSGQAPRLKVTLTGSDTAPLEYDFPLSTEGPPAWQSATIDLPTQGGSLTAHFDLESGAGEEEAICVLGEAALQRPGRSAPTVLLITSDTHRADYVGFANSGVDVRTPFLDNLARTGLVFEDCLSSTNVTNPSHVALMTGTHPLETGVIGNDTPLALSAPTLAEAFRASGYATWAAVSAVHLNHDRSGLGQGFERLSAPSELQRDSSETIAEVVRWLPDGNNKPLFLWLHLFDVHAPYDPPDDWKRRYYPAERDPYDESTARLSPVVTPHWDREVRDLAYLEALYRSEISYMDEGLKGLLSRPRFARALVAFTSDHGESLDTHNVYWDHRELYPNTLQIPLVLAGPQLPDDQDGQRRTDPVRQIDLGRTLLDLCDLQDVPFPGNNLIGSDNPGPRFALSANGSSAAVSLGSWFLSLHLTEHRSNPELDPIPKHTVELYDLEQDPRCLTDLSASDMSRTGRMRELLLAWLAAGERKGWTVARSFQDLAALNQLKALGYAGDEGNPDGKEWVDPQCACERCAVFE
jgi:arylsulfatase A-like enzyme